MEDLKRVLSHTSGSSDKEKDSPQRKRATRQLGSFSAAIAAAAVNFPLPPSQTPESEPNEGGVFSNISDSVSRAPIILSSGTAVDILTVISLAAPLPGLAPAVAAMNMIFRSIQRVQYNRERCEVMGLKARDLIIIICEHADRSERNALKGLIDQTNLILENIHRDIQIWATWGFVHSWMYRHEVLKKVNENEISLQRCREQLSMAAALDVQGKASKIEDVVVKLSAKFDTLQAELLHPKSADSQQAAQKEIFQLRTNPNRDIVLALPLELPGECQKVGTIPITRGATYDVWEGLWLGTKKVCLKEYRDFADSRKDQNKILERFKRQVDIWRGMHNPYVLEFNGWTHLDDPSQLWLVTPWMDKGDIAFFMKGKTIRPRKVIEWMKEIAEGIQYIHSKNVFHGYIQPSNILINDYEHAIVADLTMAKVIEADAMITHSRPQPNAYRYRAPEVSQGEKMAPSADLYSWAMVSLEIASRKIPYWTAKSAGEVVKILYMENILPQRSDYACDTFDSIPGVWDLLVKCWNHDASKRPTVEEILPQLDAFLIAAL